jgi:hypothetical protein
MCQHTSIQAGTNMQASATIGGIAMPSSTVFIAAVATAAAAACGMFSATCLKAARRAALLFFLL